GRDLHEPFAAFDRGARDPDTEAVQQVDLGSFDSRRRQIGKARLEGVDSEAGGGSHPAAFRLMRNSAPRSTAPSDSSPPNARTRRRAMARPRPVPPRARAVVKKRSKMRCAFPVDTPTPLSRTSTMTSRSINWPEIVTEACAPACWRALSSRLASTISNEARSM